MRFSCFFHVKKDQKIDWKPKWLRLMTNVDNRKKDLYSLNVRTKKNQEQKPLNG